MCFFIAAFFCSLSSVSLQPSCICPLQHSEIMETTPIEASSSTAPAVPLSGQKRPREPSPDNPPSSLKKLRTRKSTKHKKKKRLDQYKLTRKDIPDNARALKVSVARMKTKPDNQHRAEINYRCKC